MKDELLVTMEAETTRRVYRARDASNIPERTGMYAGVQAIDIPLVDIPKRDRLAEPANETAADSTVRRTNTVNAYVDSLQAGHDVTIDVKRPASRDSAKQRFDELKINFIARYGPAVKSILFLGTSRGDGASTAAFTFAQSLAQDLDTRVLFVNADLRGPASAYGRSDQGLSSLAEPHDDAPLPALQGNVHVLPSGRNYADPAVLFQSKRFQRFMTEVSGQFDYIVFDGPPLDEAPESVALCTRVDGVILVLDAQLTRRKIALRAKARIQEVGGKLLGVVLNRRKYYIPGWLYKII